MRKREELTSPNACMVRAHDDEPTFVLLARDEDAPGTVRDWIARRIRSGKNLPSDGQMKEAEAIAAAMEGEGWIFKNRPPAVQWGAALIAGERERQKAKGYTDEHDDAHGDGMLLHAAMLLVVDEAGHTVAGVEPPTMQGPWPDQLLLWVNNKYMNDEIRRLVIAGAMVAAEIDRLIRDDLRRAADDARLDAKLPE